MQNTLAEARAALGMSQTQLAARLDIDRSTLSKLEKGPWHHLGPHLTKITRALGLPPEAIIQPSTDSEMRSAIQTVLQSSQSNGCIVLTQSHIERLQAAM